VGTLVAIRSFWQAVRGLYDHVDGGTEAKMISRPSGVQTSSGLKPFKEVRRFGSPLGFKSSVRSIR
jgi:hypothetical protein